MSWLSENYEKTALGVCFVSAIGLAFIGWSKFTSSDEDFQSLLMRIGKNDPSISSNDGLLKTLSSFRHFREWSKGGKEDRPLDLFTGVPLFLNKSNIDRPIDLVTDSPVHPPIPNTWWIENHVDPGFGNSPKLDADQDGYSNLEEFHANTNPNNVKSHPPLIGKLQFNQLEAVKWVLRPGFESEDGSYTFEYDQGSSKNRVTAVKPISKGELFFDKEPAKGRFKLIGSEKKNMYNEVFKQDTEVTIVKVEDQRPNKKGLIYEIPAMFALKDASKHVKVDKTAVLSLEALGYQGKEFRVEENTTFALPFESENKIYKIKNISDDNLTVEVKLEGGKSKIHKISKGKLSAQ